MFQHTWEQKYRNTAAGTYFLRFYLFTVCINLQPGSTKKFTFTTIRYFKHLHLRNCVNNEASFYENFTSNYNYSTSLKLNQITSTMPHYSRTIENDVIKLLFLIHGTCMYIQVI